MRRPVHLRLPVLFLVLLHVVHHDNGFSSRAQSADLGVWQPAPLATGVGALCSTAGRPAFSRQTESTTLCTVSHLLLPVVCLVSCAACGCAGHKWWPIALKQLQYLMRRKCAVVVWWRFSAAAFRARYVHCPANCQKQIDDFVINGHRVWQGRLLRTTLGAWHRVTWLRSAAKQRCARAFMLMGRSKLLAAFDAWRQFTEQAAHASIELTARAVKMAAMNGMGTGDSRFSRWWQQRCENLTRRFSNELSTLMVDSQIYGTLGPFTLSILLGNFIESTCSHASGNCIARRARPSLAFLLLIIHWVAERALRSST